MTAPLIAVIGTTGVGKSKLAVELAEALRESRQTDAQWKEGRVINADAMQVYRGLDIITNKIPMDERNGVEHVLMGFKEPGEQFVVGEWIGEAINIIEDYHKQSILPIVAGGTLYWVQHLIFPERLTTAPTSTIEEVSRSQTPASGILRSRLETLAPPLRALYEDLPSREAVATLSEEQAWSLHGVLQHLDPEMASRWHWRDSRKVLRSLEILQETGNLASESVRSQDHKASLPRMPSLVFWLYARPDVLEPRLDARVDEMIKGGLIDELQELRNIAATLPVDEQGLANDHSDSTTGIFQSIGYKEFADLLASSPTSLDQTSETFRQGVDRMKLSTRQYSRRQVKWIRNRLIPAIVSANEIQVNEGEQTRIYLLDATELGSRWNTDVRDKAIAIMQAFLKGKPEDLPEPASLSQSAKDLLALKRSALAPSATLEARRKRICSTCTKDPERPVMLEEGREWELHIKTRTHRRLENAGKHDDEIQRLREEARIRREAKTQGAVGSPISEYT
ncbi:tRNA isopentenyltransferase [Clavulina sp. PMI_390]|nr:tRNA isopentenyltransferase [Clavulina sp. PMI_390]